MELFWPYFTFSSSWHHGPVYWAWSRAEIDLVTKKLELRKIAIVGLGGTGSYVLDLVAKKGIRVGCLVGEEVVWRRSWTLELGTNKSACLITARSRH